MDKEDNGIGWQIEINLAQAVTTTKVSREPIEQSVSARLERMVRSIELKRVSQVKGRMKGPPKSIVN